MLGARSATACACGAISTSASTVSAFHPRAWPDQAHLAYEDVQELWQLVERAPPQPPPHAGHARVFGDLEESLLRLVAVPERVLQRLGVGHHGAELEHVEAPAVAPDAQLAEEHGPAAVELDRDRYRDQQGRDRQQADGRANQIERALDRGR